MLGATWRWLWSAKGNSTTSLARTFGSSGVQVDADQSRTPRFTNDSRERGLARRHQSTWHWRPGHPLTWGAGLKGLLSELGCYAAADTKRLNT